MLNNFVTSVARQLPEHRGLAVSRGHSPSASNLGDAERLAVIGGDSPWLELSRKRSASGSCLSPHSLKSSSPGGRSKHFGFCCIMFQCGTGCSRGVIGG